MTAASTVRGFARPHPGEVDFFPPPKQQEPVMVSRLATFAMASLLCLACALDAMAARVPERTTSYPVAHRPMPPRQAGVGVPSAQSGRWRAEREAWIARQRLREEEWRNAHITIVQQRGSNQQPDPHTVRIDDGH
jgi:hypothetical protein